LAQDSEQIKRQTTFKKKLGGEKLNDSFHEDPEPVVANDQSALVESL